MKLESSFEKFDQFTDAGEAVPQLHDVAPDLAVKGKLTNRDLTKESVDFADIEGSSSDALQVFPAQFCNCARAEAQSTVVLLFGIQLGHCDFPSVSPYFVSSTCRNWNGFSGERFRVWCSFKESPAI